MKSFLLNFLVVFLTLFAPCSVQQAIANWSNESEIQLPQKSIPSKSTLAFQNNCEIHSTEFSFQRSEKYSDLFDLNSSNLTENKFNFGLIDSNLIQLTRLDFSFNFKASLPLYILYNQLKISENLV